MDHRLREIERRASQGDPEARVALLVAKTRAGEIPYEHVRLAAWLEDDLAKQIIGNKGNKASSKPRRWARGLAKNGGEEASARAVVVVYRAMASGLKAIPEPVGWKRQRRNYAWYNPRDDRPHHSFGIATMYAERWLTTKSDDDAQQVLAEVETYRADRNNRQSWRINRLPLCYLDDVVKGNASAVVESSIVAAIPYLSPSHSKWGRGKADEALRKAIVDDLIPWALGRETA
jgi:hypothetical protein